MRRKLFAVLSLVVLLSLVTTSVFAAEPEAPAIGTEYYWRGWGLLGEQFTIIEPAFDPITGDSVNGPFLLNWPVDVWLYRPDTDPFVPMFPAEWAALPGPWWVKAEGESSLRRQSWPRFQGSDSYGWYYAKFMVPRENTWYPCGFPCRWVCNEFSGPPFDVWDVFHSPYEMDFVYPDIETATYWPLFWPWDLDWWVPGLGFINPYGPPPLYLWYWYDPMLDATPFDTIHPLEIWVTEGWGDNAMYIYEAGVLGYQWKTSDPEVHRYYEDWPYLCGDPWEWPPVSLGLP
jgi:hypothetical protein